MNTTKLLHLLFGNGRQRMLLAGATACVCLSTASAATIGLKLGVNGNGGLQVADAQALLPDDLAGAPDYAQTNWVVMGRWGSVTGIWDSDGVTNAGVTVHWDATGRYRQSADLQGTPDGNLMNGYNDSNGGAAVALTNGLSVYAQGGGSKPLVYISGLAAWLANQGANYYDVVVYADGDATSSRTGEYWLVDASGAPTSITFGGDLTTHAFICDRANFINTLTYTKVPLISSRAGDAWAGNYLGNYVVFDSMSADSFLLRADEVQFPGGTLRSPINAIQIVPRTTPQVASIAPIAPCQTVAGGTARFSALVGGRAPLGYQWLKNGTPLSDAGNVSGATTPTLVISGVSSGDVASYSLVVTNAIGSVTSEPTTLSLATTAAGSYAQKVMDNVPYAYWRLNDLSDPYTNGPAMDIAGGFNGTYGSASLNGPYGIVGPQPSAFPGFEANNAALQSVNNTPGSFVTCPPLNLTNNTVTLTAWIYPTAYTEPAYTGIIVSRNGGDTCGLSYGSTANYLGYNWNNQSGAYSFQSGLLVPSNIWSFVAVVVTPTNAILYMNNATGQFSATNSTITNAVAGFSGPTMIGADPNAFSRVFSGSIDEAAVFNRSLSPVEISALYKKGLGLDVIKAVISKSPQSLALMEGRPAKFSVAASGDLPLSYKWRHNNTYLSETPTITGVESPTLSISAVTLADAGTYDVVVQNIGGTATSDPATLTVVVSNSAPVAYEAALRAANPIAYWRLNEAASSPEAYDYWGGNIVSHSFVTTGVDGPRSPEFLGMETDNAAASYDGFSGASSSQASLLSDRSQFSVIGWFNAPTQEQQNRAGLFGQNDVCEFGFHGDVGSQQVGVWTPRAGAYLPISSITPGQWFLIAAVGDGSNINLYLVSTNSENQIQMASTAHTATTNYGSSTDPFRIGGGGILDTTGNFFTGQIDEVAVFDRALTANELSDLLGAALVGGELAPTFSKQPATNTTLYAGRTFSLTPVALGKNLHYQWRKGGVPISDSDNVSGTATDVLTITGVTVADEGDYDLVVTNGVGAVTSTLAHLTVVLPTSAYESVAVSYNPAGYWRLNDLGDPSTNAPAVDFYSGLNGTYGIATLNGYNLVAGPRPTDGFSAFESANAAVQTINATANAYVTVPPLGITTDTITITAWVNPSAYNDRAGIVFARAGQPATGINFINTGNLNYHWLDTATTYGWDSGLNVPTNQWSFVALVVEPTKATMYLLNANGMQSAVNAVTHAARAFTDNIRIGGDPNGDARTFNGLIDEVAIFNAALSPSEIQGLYLGTPLVSLSVQNIGGNVVLTWPQGTLLEADDVTGPYTTNNVTSPYTNAPASKKFYRVIVK